MALDQGGFFIIALLFCYFSLSLGVSVCAFLFNILRSTAELICRASRAISLVEEHLKFQLLPCIMVGARGVPA
jgi:hypothetical protein